MTWIPAIRIDDLPVGTGRGLTVAGRRIAVFRTADDRLYAIEDRCPHADLPLSEGALTGTVVVCPHHGYRMDVATGASPRARAICVARFAVRLDGDDVLIDPAPLPPAD